MADEELRPLHLNGFGLVIRSTDIKGRGVYATRSIPAGTLIDISPVILFGKEEYHNYGRFTVVDHYTFVWRDGRMALALGLGSIFNHSSDHPNVSYSLDIANSVIRFTTMRSVNPGDELCIFYGSKLWFENKEKKTTPTSQSQTDDEQVTDPWGGLSKLEVTDHEDFHEAIKLTQIEAGIFIKASDAPLARLRMPEETEPETEDSPVKTMQIWAVDILDLSKTGKTLECITQDGDTFGKTSLRHLKRIRKSIDSSTGTTSTLALSEVLGSPPSLPEELIQFHGSPYIVTVPASAAYNQTQLKKRAALWPVVFMPTLDAPKEKQWTTSELYWVQNGLQMAVTEAKRAKQNGELAIGAYVPSMESSNPKLPSFWAHDTRVSSSHPLRHACMNIVRKVADAQTTTPTIPSSSEESQNERTTPSIEILPSTSTLPSPAFSSPVDNSPSYLLTSLSLFVTHEPCIMCTMALLHSRVKQVFYIFPMPLTGGCGGLVKESVPGLKGVNHKFPIWKWTGDTNVLGIDGDNAELIIPRAVDA